MAMGLDSAAQWCAEGLAAKTLQVAASLKNALNWKSDPASMLWWDGVESMRNISSFFGREEIGIYLKHFPPLQGASLFSYYQGMQIEPRLLPATVVRLAALPLADFYFPTRPWVRKAVYALSGVFLVLELFPSVAYPVIHNILLRVLRLRYSFLAQKLPNAM
ncbi:transmembrane protein [Cystoisospora suis]|uniref:Transmembrane protein n=1 Tax=Cystoisospora suis TaxID=483139 RepID=A0A2C6L461_9APIC|nr:transmembrane protein [Cystoisospora suis]